MPWQKGQSGNPGGRPKGYAEVERIARQHSALALKTLAEICRNEDAPPPSRVAAATALLDRGFGRPAQHIEANVNVLDNLSDASIGALVAALENSSAGSEDHPGGMPAHH